MIVLDADRAILPDGDDLRVCPARVTIDGAMITHVEPLPQGPAPAGADRLAAPWVLAPAFVDAHTHLALHALRGAASTAASAGNLVEDVFFQVERAMTPDDIRALSRVGALEALLAGTAVVHDHYYAADAVLDASHDVGLAAIVAPALQDLDGPGMHDHDAVLALTAALDARPELAARGSGVMVGPHATDTVSTALLRRIVDLATARDLPIHLHVAQSLDEVARAAHHGTTPLGRLAADGLLDAGPRWQLVHGLFLTDGDLARLDPSRHALVACPRAWARFGFPAPVHRWRDAGVPILAGSDAAASNDAFGVQGELAPLAALWTADTAATAAHDAWRHNAGPAHAASAWDHRRARHAARPRAAALFRAATDLPGHIHPRLQSGRIAAGHLAHLALWDTSHPALWPGDDPVSGLVFGRPAGALHHLMVAGRWVGERGHFAASVLAAARDAGWIDEATARRRALLDRAGVATV